MTTAPLSPAVCAINMLLCSSCGMMSPNFTSTSHAPSNSFAAKVISDLTSRSSPSSSSSSW